MSKFDYSWYSYAKIQEEGYYWALHHNAEVFCCYDNSKPFAVGKFTVESDHYIFVANDPTVDVSNFMEYLYSPVVERSGDWYKLNDSIIAMDPEWLHSPLWICFVAGGEPQIGYYEWQQGHHPDRLIVNGHDYWAIGKWVKPIAVPGTVEV